MKCSLIPTLVLSAGILLAGCANPGETATPNGQGGLTPSEAVGDVAQDDAARALLPAAIRDGGVLKVGGETQLPPYLSMNGDQIVGIEADFMVALGKKLGLKPEIQPTKFAVMITGLTSKRIDVAMSDFSDTLERQQQVTFVDYTKAGQRLIVQHGNPENLQTLGDLCGHRAGGPAGSLSIKLAQEQSAKCTAEGKPAIEINEFPSGSDASQALQSHRVDVLAFDAAIAAELARQLPDSVEVAGDMFGQGHHGAAVRPEDTQLAKALVAAFNSMIEDATYDRIIQKWDIEQMSMEQAEINATKQ